MMVIMLAVARQR